MPLLAFGLIWLTLPETKVAVVVVVVNSESLTSSSGRSNGKKLSAKGKVISGDKALLNSGVITQTCF